MPQGFRRGNDMVTEPEGESQKPGIGHMLDVCLSVVAWNGRDLLRSCLESVFNTARKVSFSVVVVDNASTEDVQGMLRKDFPRVEIIRNGCNAGFARANNQVLRRYSGKARYFLLLNPDTVVASGAIDDVVAYMDEHPEAGVIGCKLTKPDGTLDWPCKRSFLTPSMFLYRALHLDTLFPNSPRFGKYQLTYLDENQIHEVDSVVGAFLMIRAETVQQIGLLDEQFYMYGEDLDWCYRARRAGWKVVYYPEARVAHYKSQSSNKRSYFMICWWYKALWLVYRRHCASQYHFLLNSSVWAGLYGMCGLSLARNFFRSQKRIPSRTT